MPSVETNRSEALAAAIRNGEPEAWEYLYRACYPRLLAYARRRLPTLDQAREAVGETMVRAVAGGDRLRNDGAGLDAWLYGILRHVVLDAQRRMARPTPALAWASDGVTPDPVEFHLDAEDRAAIREAFGRLGRADQELLELRVVGGLSAEQVADILGRTPGAVRMAQSRALARLRGLMVRTDTVEALRVGA